MQDAGEQVAENVNEIDLITHLAIMAIEFIGRKLEKEVLKEAIDSSEAEMVAVIGRRRIGKTFLITSVYKNEIVFEISGLQMTIVTIAITL